MAVPTHLFKVVLGERKHKKPAMAVFIIPNKDVRRAPLSLFQVSLEQLESVCGWTFFPKLDRSRVSKLGQWVESDSGWVFHFSTLPCVNTCFASVFSGGSHVAWY